MVVRDWLLRSRVWFGLWSIGIAGFGAVAQARLYPDARYGIHAEASHADKRDEQLLAARVVPHFEFHFGGRCDRENYAVRNLWLAGAGMHRLVHYLDREATDVYRTIGRIFVPERLYMINPFTYDRLWRGSTTWSSAWRCCRGLSGSLLMFLGNPALRQTVRAGGLGR